VPLKGSQAAGPKYEPSVVFATWEGSYVSSGGAGRLGWAVARIQQSIRLEVAKCDMALQVQGEQPACQGVGHSSTSHACLPHTPLCTCTRTYCFTRSAQASTPSSSLSPSC
jgi:hypothetical protein